jgi:hypothetical protein
MYGLGIGASHGYTIPGPLFTPYEDSARSSDGKLLSDRAEAGRWQFRFRFTPLSEGTIFSGSLALENTAAAQRPAADQSVDLDLSWSENTLVLTYALGNVGLTERLVLEESSPDAVITAVINFNLDKNNLFRAWLGLSPADTIQGEVGAGSLGTSSLGAGSGETSSVGIPLPGALSGDGKFRLGAAIPREVPRELLLAPGEKVPEVPSNLVSAKLLPEETVQPGRTSVFRNVKAVETTGTGPAAVLNEVTVIFISNSAGSAANIAGDEIDLLQQSQAPVTPDLRFAESSRMGTQIPAPLSADLRSDASTTSSEFLSEDQRSNASTSASDFSSDEFTAEQSFTAPPFQPDTTGPGVSEQNAAEPFIQITDAPMVSGE